jgi:hypothetical protein
MGPIRAADGYASRLPGGLPVGHVGSLTAQGKEADSYPSGGTNAEPPEPLQLKGTDDPTGKNAKNGGTRVGGPENPDESDTGGLAVEDRFIDEWGNPIEPWDVP